MHENMLLLSNKAALARTSELVPRNTIIHDQNENTSTIGLTLLLIAGSIIILLTIA